MGSKTEKEKDFFISYTGRDLKWATWIAETLRSNGYTMAFQPWDFKGGGSFINDMHEAIKTCEKIVLVVSQKYFESDYCNAEWQNYICNDPVGKKTSIYPIRIENIKPDGLLTARTYIDLFDIDKFEAEKRLLDFVDPNPKERKSAGYPGKRSNYPGQLPFNNLPDRNAYFAGREDILQSISSAFEKKEGVVLTQTVSGLGGIGKTQTAIEFAYRYASRYDCIWLVNAEKNETLYDGLLKFTEKMCGFDSTAATPEKVKDLVREWTARNESWLFIFDNAEDYGVLSGYLPQNNAGQGNVLITSRNEFWDKTGRKALRINVFSEEEATEFLRGRTGIENDDETAKELCITLGGLPLALELAAAYISENDSAFSEYIELYKRYKLELLGQNLREGEASVDTIWQMSIDKINNDSARQLLYICSYCAPDHVDTDALIRSNPYLPSPLLEAAADELKFKAALRDLRRFSLIRLEGKNISLHRILQEAVKCSVEPDTQYLACCFEHINDLMSCCDYDTKEERDESRALLPHAISVYENTGNFCIEFNDAYKLCLYIADGLSELAVYTESISFYNKALKTVEKVLGVEHSDTATAYNNIAIVYQAMGDYDKAMEYNNKALAICEKVLGKEHPDIATTYNNIAVNYKAMGDYDKAMEYNKKALAICEKVLGKDHPDTATTYNNIAIVYNAMGDYDKALEFYKKALAICEKVLGKEHPDTATTYSNIAVVCKDMDDNNMALEFNNKALVIREKVLGKEHPDTATTYNNIAGVYQAMGDNDKALDFNYKALAIREKVLGNEHPAIATTYNNIAGIYRAMGDYDKALVFNHKALVIREKVLGKEHPNTATTYNNIATVYYSIRNYDKALRYSLMAFKVFNTIFDADHPSIKDALGNLFSCFQSSSLAGQDFNEWLIAQLDQPST